MSMRSRIALGTRIQRNMQIRRLEMLAEWFEEDDRFSWFVVFVGLNWRAGGYMDWEAKRKRKKVRFTDTRKGSRQECVSMRIIL